MFHPFHPCDAPWISSSHFRCTPQWNPAKNTAAAYGWTKFGEPSSFNLANGSTSWISVFRALFIMSYWLVCHVIKIGSHATDALIEDIRVEVLKFQMTQASELRPKLGLLYFGKWYFTKQNKTKWNLYFAKWKSVLCETKICTLQNENLYFAKRKSVLCEVKSVLSWKLQIRKT